MSGLQDRIAKLELRLHDGFARIGEAMQNGVDVAHWERTWVELLREYETLFDELAAAQPEQTEMVLGVRREAA